MSKRIISILIIVSMLTAAMPFAVVNADSRASNYINSCYASLSSGSSSGELKVTYSVTAPVSGITRLGIIAIFVYHPDGSIARIISGSTANGLIRTSGTIARGTYTIDLDPGESYYCNIRFIAENASGSDTPLYTTNTATTPR